MERARSGGGPTLLECKTYRLRPHSNADDDRKYRTEEEVAEWRERDPIARLERYILEHNLATPDDIAGYRQVIAAEVEQAIEAAEQADEPALESLYSHLYEDKETRGQGTRRQELNLRSSSPCLPFSLSPCLEAVCHS